MAKDKIVIAHRGACGYLPEHTLAAYALAYALGADFLEPDVVATADGHLICCHDIHLDRTTDVAARYPERARADGRWYAADLSLAEVKTLAAIERIGDDDKRVFETRYIADARGFGVPALTELLDLVASLNRQSGRRVGVYPETKAPEFHIEHGLALEPRLIARLADYGYLGSAGAPLFIQSFSAKSLCTIRAECGPAVSLIQLIDGAPREADRLTPTGLDRIAGYADGIGPDKHWIVASDGELVRNAHARNLCVHPYTFRADQLGAGHATLTDELAAYYHDYDVDGVFTDFCDIAVALVHPERSIGLKG